MLRKGERGSMKKEEERKKKRGCTEWGGGCQKQ